MYDNILHKPLQIQGTKTVAACDILQGLLHKDQKRRLGAKTDFVGGLHYEQEGGRMAGKISILSISFITALPWKNLPTQSVPSASYKGHMGFTWISKGRERGGGQIRTPVCKGSFLFRGFQDPHVLRICGYGYGVTSSLS